MLNELNITAVFAAITGFFMQIYDFMSGTYITVLDYSVSLFQLFTGCVMVSAIMAVMLPWYEEEDED